LAHFWLIFKLIFGSFLSIWQRNKQKGTKNGMENDVKIGYREHPGNGIIEKWSKNAFFSPGTVPKRAKMIIFRFPFCKSEGRVPFSIFFFSFSVSFSSTMELK
jgi:hypothetical protein